MNLDLQECELGNRRGNLAPTISLVGFEAYFMPYRHGYAVGMESSNPIVYYALHSYTPHENVTPPKSKIWIWAYQFKADELLLFNL